VLHKISLSASYASTDKLIAKKFCRPFEGFSLARLLVGIRSATKKSEKIAARENKNHLYEEGSEFAREHGVARR